MDNLAIPSSKEPFTASVRFTIMLILYTHERIEFSKLQKLLKLTSGNLDHHLKKLQDANLIKSRKEIFPERPLTAIRITELGKRKFKEYISNLKNILDEIAIN